MRLKEFLLQTAEQIHALEAKKKQAIAAENKAEYLEAVQEKAAILSKLYENAKKHDISEVNIDILAALQGFSASAKQALAFNSPWFMSELLIPEDYQENAPNNLDKLIEKL